MVQRSVVYNYNGNDTTQRGFSSPCSFILYSATGFPTFVTLQENIILLQRLITLYNSF